MCPHPNRHEQERQPPAPPDVEMLERRLLLSGPSVVPADAPAERNLFDPVPPGGDADAAAVEFEAAAPAATVEAAVAAVAPLPLRMDMVHHNPGAARTQSEFLDPAHLSRLGYTTQVLNDYPQAAVTFDAFDPAVFPAGSAGRAWVLARAAQIDRQVAAAHAAGLKVFYWTDFVVLPKTLVSKYRSGLTDAAGRIDVQRPLTQQVIREMLREVFARFPGIDGLVVRTGEVYTQDVPYHTGSNPIIRGPASHVALLNLLRDELCVKRGRTLVYRTWDLLGDAGFHANRDYYLAVTDAVAPHANLYFAVKEQAGDYHRMTPFNPTIGIGRHRQVVEVECQREYEGKGSSPDYIGKGVIDGWEEYAWMNPAGRPDGLRDLVGNPRFAGVWTWSRGGGWDGPYIREDFWTDLNAYVVSQWARNPGRSEASIFNDFAAANGLTGGQADLFRQLCLLSADAVLRGRLSTAGGVNVWWTRDEYIGGLPLLRDYFKKVIAGGRVNAVLAEKADAVAKWRRMEALSRQITLPSAARTEFLRTSTTYGRIQYEIFQQAWTVMLYGLKGDLTGTYDRSKIDPAIARYDALWREWRALRAGSPTCATLYTDRAFRGDAANGVGASIDRYRKAPPVVVTPPPGTTILQAESAARTGVLVAAANAGYTGTGYVDFQHATGDSVRWTVTAPAAARYTLGFRYANGAADRPLELRVNGVVARSRLSFPGTGAWTAWKEVTATVDLRAGANTVTLTAVGANGPNLDWLAYRAA